LDKLIQEGFFMEMEEAKMEIFPNIGRNDYPRSNARSRYRRPDAATRSGHIRRNIGRAANEKIAPSTFKERLIFQATICGGFLAVLLFFNIIDTDFTNGVTGWIEQNIAFDMLAEDGGVGDWVGSVLGIFGNDAEDNMLPYYEVHHDASTRKIWLRCK